MSTRARFGPGLLLGLVAVLVTALLTGSVQVGATAATQSGSTTLSAPYVQPGARPAASGEAKLVGTVRFTPARKGRPVVIQRSADGITWTDVARKKQNASGVVTFTAPAYQDLPAPLEDTAYAYRGVAKSWGGLSSYAANAQSAGVWEPKFSDEFSGTGLGEQWADRKVKSKECAKVGDPRARKVAHGTLRLMVKRDPARKGRKCKTSEGKFRYYLNGQVSTEQVPVAFTHGTMSARIKFHKNRGAHGAFWMQPTRRVDGAHPARAGAEVDIAEFFGKGYQKGGLASFIYNYGITDRHHQLVKIGGMAPSATRMLPRRDAWWKRFHVFSVEWTEGAYRFSVDGRQHSVLTRGVTNVDEFLILGLMTSAWELKQAKRLGVRPGGTMQVDWVRVWQRG